MTTTLIPGFTPAQEKEFLREPSVVPTSDGIDQWAIYFEYLDVDSALAATRETRVLIAHNFIYTHRREADKTKSVWRGRECDSSNDALRRAVRSFSSRASSVLRADPILVQLTSSDVKQIQASTMPGARYRAQYAFERLHSKFEFDGNPVKCNSITTTPRLGELCKIRAEADRKASVPGPATSTGAGGATATMTSGESSSVTEPY